ncbi:MAG: hypothetical protein Q8L88_14265, partial [Bacteroidota bacterium]|nr:hypothetical protein [Bacteroidota bacterium]
KRERINNMGTSKIAMLSGIYLILGMYTVSFTAADRNNSSISESVANSIQAEQIARTGISLAMTKMGGTYSSSTRSYGAQNATVMNGSVVYSASQTGLPASQSQVTSTGTFAGKTITVKAVFSYDRNRWRLIRMYVPPTA